MIEFFEENKTLSWFITLTGAVLIFYVSSVTFSVGPKTAGTNLIPILYHILAFFFFSFFLLISLTSGKKIQLFIPGIILSIFYALSDEIHQFFVPGRACASSDLIWDSTGILLASMIYLNLIIYKKIKIFINQKNLYKS